MVRKTSYDDSFKAKVALEALKGENFPDTAIGDLHLLKSVTTTIVFPEIITFSMS